MGLDRFGRPKRVLYCADIVQHISLFLSYIGTGMCDISSQESFLLFRYGRDEFKVSPDSDCGAKYALFCFHACKIWLLRTFRKP